jgi:hypothetical protein
MDRRSSRNGFVLFLISAHPSVTDAALSGATDRRAGDGEDLP